MLLRNYEALDFLESQAGRVAFKLPEPDITLERKLVAVSHLIREVGEALESVAETLADGVDEESELRITIPKLEAVIQECASRVLSFVDHAHPATAKLLDDTIVRDDLANHGQA